MESIGSNASPPPSPSSPPVEGPFKTSPAATNPTGPAEVIVISDDESSSSSGSGFNSSGGSSSSTSMPPPAMHIHDDQMEVPPLILPAELPAWYNDTTSWHTGSSESSGPPRKTKRVKLGPEFPSSPLISSSSDDAFSWNEDEETEEADEDSGRSDADSPDSSQD
jgi:hypothetical protein